MFSLNALGAADLLLAFGYALGLFLLVRAAGKGLAGSRAAGMAVAPAVAGLALILLLLMTSWSDSLRIFRLSISGMRQPFSTAAILVAVMAAVAAGDLALNRAARIAHAVIVFVTRQGAHGASPATWTVDAALAVVLIGGVGATAVLAKALRPGTGLEVFSGGRDFQFAVEATHELPGLPQGMIFRGERDGYLSLGGQGIMRFVLPSQPDGKLSLELVASDLNDPRGLAILKDTLYVTHLDPMPGIEIGQGPSAGERVLLSPKGGSVIAFDILPDGKLQNRRVIIPDLPVVNPWHAVNSIIAGADGRLYATISGSRETEPYAQLPLLGTVVSFNPDGSGLEIFARGIRNIYDLTFDDQGRLFGTDNDGPSVRGFKGEEVVNIRKGDHFGYPLEGTFDVPHRVRTAPPLWVLPDANSGSAGIEWAENVGLAPGLFIGGPHLVYLPLGEDDQGLFVPTEGNVEPGQIVLTRQGFFSIVQAGPDRRLYVGVYGFTRTNELYVLKFR